MRAISFLLLIGIIANSADAAPTQFTEHVPAEHFEVDAVVGEAYAFDSSEVDELPEMIQAFRPEQMTAARAIHIVKAVSELKKSAKSPMLGKVSKLLATSAVANPSHKEKLKATVARKSELVAKLDEIMNQLKSEYDEHKQAAQAEEGSIEDAKTGIEDNQFGPLVKKAKKWCKTRKAQEAKKKAIPAKSQAEADAKEATIPSPKKWESEASNFEVTYQKGAGYTAVDFSAATTFQTQFNTARKNYWEAKKAHFEANEEHTITIESANLDGAAFKSAINELAAAIATQCADFKGELAKQIIVDFNTQNIKRASVFSILELVKCHVENIDRTDPVTCTKSDVKSDFADLQVPSTECPTTAKLKEVIQNKKTDLNFHFEGADDSPSIDDNGNFVSGRGWTPTQDACANVDTHAETLFGKAYPFVWAYNTESCTEACKQYGDQECDEARLREVNGWLVGGDGLTPNREKFNKAIKQSQPPFRDYHCNAWTKKGPNARFSEGGDGGPANQKQLRHIWPCTTFESDPIKGPTGKTHDGKPEPKGKQCFYGEGSLFQPTCNARTMCVYKFKHHQTGAIHTVTQCQKYTDDMTKMYTGAGSRFCACKAK